MLGSFLQENGDTDVDILQEVQDAVPKKRKDEDVFLGMGGTFGSGVSPDRLQFSNVH